MTVVELYRKLNETIPSSLSLDWDNDGLMCCPDPDREVNSVLCVLDVTPDTVHYAVEHEYDVIISHHPLIFKPLTSIIAPKLINLIKNGITVISFHTRLDIIDGGINDLLAFMLDLYGVISFAGGAGRIGTLANPVLFNLFGGRLKNILGSDKIKGVNACQTVHKIAVVSGSGGDFIGEAISLGADTFISGECGYHRMLDAKEAGINVFEAGHFFTEKHAAGYIKNLLIKGDFNFKVDIYEQNYILSI